MRKKNKNGEGSFRQQSGKWNYRVMYRNSEGELKSKSFTAPTQLECYELAEAFFERLDRITPGADMTVTITELLKEKYESDFRKNFTREQGYRRNLNTLKIIEKHPISRIPVADIKPHQIELFLQSITHYSDSSIKKLYGQLNMAFRLGMDKGIIVKNPLSVRDLRRPNSDKKTNKVTGLTLEEQGRFEKAVKEYAVRSGSNDYRLQLLIELYSGMRMGEINALMPEDIDLTREVIHVRRTVAEGLDGIFINDTTKTSNGMRTIPVSRMLKPVLLQALAEMKKNPYGLIFYDYRNNHIVSTQSVNAMYKTILRKADIPYRGQHSLRHTFATRCIEFEVPAVVLKTWLGHSDIHITLDTYADVFTSMHNDAIGRYDESMNRIRRIENE